MKQLTGKESTTKSIPTTVATIDQSDIDLGRFDKSERREIIFRIENVGNNPLVIVHASTTCGCTVVKFEKQPVKPGEQLQVHVQITPKDTGFLQKR